MTNTVLWSLPFGLLNSTVSKYWPCLILEVGWVSKKTRAGPFRTVAKGEERPQYRTGLDSAQTMGKWRFIAMSRSVDEKSLRGNIRYEGVFDYTDLR